jgi:hypothetical protein
MSHLLEQDRTGFFTVVGAPPIVEEHHDTHSHYHQDSFTDNKSVFVAGVWAALYAVILVVAIVGKNGVGRAVETVTALIH